jgi:hypothetical protein
MDMMINTAKKNMEILAEMQARNEEMVRVMLNHAAKTREQVVATNESLLHLVAQQGKAAEAFVNEGVKVSREIVEKQVQEARKVVAGVQA